MAEKNDVLPSNWVSPNRLSPPTGMLSVISRYRAMRIGARLSQ